MLRGGGRHRTNDASRVARSNRIRRHVRCHYAARRNNGAVADRHAFQNDGPGPHPNIVADNFSVIWRKWVAFHTDHYRLYLRVDGEAQVWINGKLALNTDAQSGQILKDVQLAAGNQLIEVHYVNRQGPARLELRWEQIS